ncbi:unnamed protein product [Darwinula stevensoni]|uniref:Peptidase S1 domain-containing protein n=1 Tax=Darwinula stevensoni TaxID=69355 RepID=A0A7R9A1X2_9CRUS|nr:unnamed protein product [Darwinula stevensoni]CAG0884489.1 unnamed protein product [Darwinula stevensoni]
MSRFFLLSLNYNLKELPDGIFGNISFASMHLSLTDLETIAPSALLPSRDRLAQLAVVHSSLEEFPFELLPSFSRLESLDLSHNALTSIPPLRSYSLQKLHLLNNLIRNVEEDGWDTPNLKELDIGKNPLLRFPSAILNGLEKLEEFSCNSCNLGPTLSSGLLDFHSKALRVVYLDENEISTLEPGAITGLQPNTIAYLRRLENVSLSEKVFRPMVEILSEGTGVLALGSKSFRCDCDIAWLLIDGTLMRSVEGGCSNGTEFRDLNLDSVKNCPRPCPYECVSNKLVSLCASGTGILSKVDDCRSHETDSQTIPSLITCDHSCVSLPNVHVCVPGTVKDETECKQMEEFCCQLLTESKESGSDPLPPFNEDPNIELPQCDTTIGRCLPVHLPGRCRNDDEREFTDLFRCSGDLRCCASKTAVEKRKLELLSIENFRVGEKQYFCRKQRIRPLSSLIYDGMKAKEHVSSIILHEEFNFYNYDSPIALVRLTEPAVLTDRVQIVCLPTGFDLLQEYLENGTQGWVAGWGHDESDILSEELTEMEIPVLSNRKCFRDIIHFTGDPSKAITLTWKMFCAGFDKETSFEELSQRRLRGGVTVVIVFTMNKMLIEEVAQQWTLDGKPGKSSALADIQGSLNQVANIGPFLPQFTGRPSPDETLWNWPVVGNHGWSKHFADDMPCLAQ